MRRATVYFDDDLHEALRIKSKELNSSVSEIVNEAVRSALRDDRDGVVVIQERRSEEPISYEAFLKELKQRNRI